MSTSYKRDLYEFETKLHVSNMKVHQQKSSALLITLLVEATSYVDKLKPKTKRDVIYAADKPWGQFLKLCEKINKDQIQNSRMRI